VKSKTWIEAFVTNFAKEDKKTKETMFAKNIIIRAIKTRDKIKCVFYKREKQDNKTKKKKVFELIPNKVRGKWKIQEEDYNKLALIVVNNNKITEKDIRETKKFGKYFSIFVEELQKNIKQETDVNKKALLNFNKYFNYWEDKTEEDIDERNLIDFCNYVLKNAVPKGSATSREKSGCYAIKMSITTLRKFLNFLFLQGKIKKETLQIAQNFVYTNFFTNCRRLQKKQDAFNYFRSLQEVREFYDLILTLKSYLEDYISGDFEEKEFIAVKLLKYKKANLLNINKAQNFLYKIYVTEFLLLTGIRGIDFFKITPNSIKWQDNFIYFSKTKNGEEYYLYLTDYLNNLALDIYNLAQQITNKDTFIATSHSSLRNFFNSFFKQQYNYNINIHGFRHTFKTLTTQYLNYNYNAIEEQIQHTKQGLDKNYLKGDLKEQRLRLLEDYRLLITPIHLKYLINVEDKERMEENIRKDINEFFNNILNKYNIKREELMRILLKSF